MHNKKKEIFHSKTGGYNPNQDALHQFPRHQQTTIFRLRRSHCRLNSYLQKIGVKTSAQCLSGEADQTPECYLQSCSAADVARLCVPQNQALGVCRTFIPDIQVCGTHRREDLVNAAPYQTLKELKKVIRVFVMISPGPFHLLFVFSAWLCYSGHFQSSRIKYRHDIIISTLYKY